MWIKNSKKVLLVLIALLLVSCKKSEVKEMGANNLKIEYLGHGSLKMFFNDKVCYIDPYAGDDYKEPADLILVTHQHSDHNQLSLVKQNDGCKVFENFDAIGKEGYNKAEFFGMEVEPVEAYNKNHKKEECVGYILRVNDKVIYIAGDTSKTKQMEKLKDYNIDYAFLPMDGKFNMDIDEAIECEKLISAKHTIPYHMAPGELFDEERAKKFDTKSTLIMKPYDIIDIK